MHYHCIIHPEGIEIAAKDLNHSLEYRTRAMKVKETIEAVLENEKNIVIIHQGHNPTKIPDYINKDDTVTLYGGIHGYCLSGARMSLMMKGIDAEYHPDGFI